MTDISHAVAALAVDYYVAATLLLAAALGVMAILRQPVERMAVAWGTMLGLAALAVLCALPAWPRISLAPRAADDAATQVATNPTAPYPRTADFVPAAQEIRPAQDNAQFKPRIPDGTYLRDVPAIRIPRPTNNDAKPPLPEESTQPLDWTSFVVVGFLLGGLGVLFWQIVGAVQLRRLCQGATPAPEFATTELRRIVGENARAPRLLVSSRVSSAAACGLWRPTILLPALLVAEPPADAVEQARLAALLSHEWAHVRRGDLWLLFLSRVLLVGLYAHPLFWLLLRRVGVDRELIADTLAAQACGRKEFAAYLVEWARRQSPRSRPTAALGIWQRRAELSRRISMLLNERIRLRTSCSRVVRCAAGVSIVVLVAALSLITLQPAPAANATATEEPAVEASDKEPEPKKVEVTLHGICLDENKQPIAGARARLLRCDAGTDQISRPLNRLRFLTGALPEVLKSKVEGGALAYNDYACNRASQRLLADVRTDKSGRFEFPPEAVDKDWQSGAAHVYICVQAPGMATEWHFARVNHPEALKPIELTLQPAMTLRGRVTDDTGRPIAGALVAAGDACNLPKLVPGLHCAVTDDAGRYEIADLPLLDVDDLMLAPVGDMTAEYLSLTGWIEHPDFATHVIEFKKTPATADAVLRRPATLSTRVVAAETGKPIPKAALNRTNNTAGTVTVVSDERGEFVAKGLEPGSYTISTTLADRPPVHQTIDLKSGANELVLTARRGGLIKGRLIDDATGKPPIKPAENTLFGQPQVICVLDSSKPEAGGGGGPVSLETAEFQIPVPPGKNHLSLFTFGESFGVSWILTDAERWQTQGVDVAQDQTVEVELRVKLNEAQPQQQYANFARWRDELKSSKKVISFETLQLLMKGGEFYVQREKVNGKEEIVMISAHLGVNPSGDERGMIAQFMNNVQIERSLLANIDEFPHLRNLQLFHPAGPGDATIESLRNLKELETLSVIDVLDYTGASVKHLAALPKLRALSLLSHTYDDAALATIARLPALRELATSGKFTDDGLAALAANPELTSLVIAKTGDGKFTDSGLAHLAKLTKLKQLDLSEVMSISEQLAENTVIPQHWAITDDGLRHLAELADLEGLTLTGPQLTDACLVHLRGLKKLKDLTVEETQITPAGMEALKKFLPELKTTVKLKPADAEPAAQGAGHWPASRRTAAVPADLQETSQAPAPESPPVKLTFEIVCLDEQQKPIAGARARLFRVDEGTDRVKTIFARLKPVEVLSPDSAESRDGSLIAGEYSCDVKSQRLLEEVRSDAAGRIVFAPLAVDRSWEAQRARMLVCVQAPGKATQWTGPTINRGADKKPFFEPCQVTMGPARTLRGRVTDKAGRPVAGALVAGNAREHLPQLVPGVQCSVTDAEGRYEITDLAPFDVNALESQTLVFEYASLAGIVEHAKYAPHVIEYQKLPATVDAVLSAPATLTAQVVSDEDGKPLAKAVVRWTSQQGENHLSHTDDKGEHVFERLEPGKYTVVASVVDRLWTTETVDLKEGANSLVLRLKRGGILKGRLIDDATGKPVILSPNIGSKVAALIVGGKPEDATSGDVDAKTAEFTMAARPGRNQLQLAVFGNTLRTAWELVDEQRWSKTGVEIAQGQTFEVELRVKPGNGIVHTLNENFGQWREALMTKEPYSEEMLRKILKHQGTATETIAGREEIIGIEIGVHSEGDGEQAEVMRIAPLERSLLAHIQKFPQLRTLSLFHPPGGDKILESLRGLQHLETLEFADALDNVTSAGVKHLATLPELQTLFLVSHKLDDAALAEFARLPKLKELSCGGVFTDAGLAQLATAKSLTTLAVASTGDSKISDAGLAHLGKLTRLKVLGIAKVMSFQEEQEHAQPGQHSLVTNDGLRHLAGLTELEALSLSGSKLTDAGLVHLRGLKKLRSLNTDGTKITPAGIEELRKFLPELKPAAETTPAQQPKED